MSNANNPMKFAETLAPPRKLLNLAIYSLSSKENSQPYDQILKIPFITKSINTTHKNVVGICSCFLGPLKINTTAVTNCTDSSKDSISSKNRNRKMLNTTKTNMKANPKITKRLLSNKIINNGK